MLIISGPYAAPAVRIARAAMRLAPALKRWIAVCLWDGPRSIRWF